MKLLSKKNIGVWSTVLFFTALLIGCESKTEFGPCVGAFEKKDAKLEYDLSLKNVFVGVVFSETVIVPIVVLKDQTFCPSGRRQLATPSVPAIQASAVAPVPIEASKQWENVPVR